LADATCFLTGVGDCGAADAVASSKPARKIRQQRFTQSLAFTRRQSHTGEPFNIA
jgi:hypothetical protein